MGSIVRYEVACSQMRLKVDALNRPDIVPMAEGDRVDVTASESVIRVLDS
jgi:hypothetical protein